MSHCQYGVISMKFKEGNFDNFSFKKFIEQLLKTIEEKMNVSNKRIILCVDNCSAHLTNYVLNSFKDLNVFWQFNPPYSP